MSFPTKLLAPGEEVYLDSLPNWSLLFWPSVLTLLIIGGCVAVAVMWSSAPTYMAWVLLGCGLAALVYLGLRYVAWRTTSFVVTSQRIVYRTGVLRRTGREIPIGRVQDVTYHQTVVERLVRAGSLTVESAGRHGQDPFPDISRPAEVQSLINRVVAQAASGYVVNQAPVAGIPEPRKEHLSEPTTDPTPRTVAPSTTQAAPAPYQAAPPPYQAAESTPGYPSAPAHPTAPAPVGPTIAQQMTELADLHAHGVITDAEYEHKRRELLDRL
ncbi:MAG: PH domain-containing protein [Acidimicrobiales bacterium]|jgi:membrane protein YdbS with pleckstrin-like domain